MEYNLLKYKYKNGKIYRRLFWFIYECIDHGPYKYKQGVMEVNRLCGVVEPFESPGYVC